MKPLVVAIALVSAAAGVCADTIDRVLAVVAGQLITLSDLNAMRDRITPAPNSADPTGDARQTDDRELMLAEVERCAARA
jgi:hypothetical protein